MKKGLSLLLAASLAFSAFTSAALAAEMTAEEKYEALVKEGIFSGYEDGQAHLDRTMNRAQAAKIVTLILGLKEDAEAAGVFVDLEDPSVAWAKGYIGAALNEGIMIGVGKNKFDPSSDVTIEQLAKIFVEALDLDYDPEATYEGASEWAGGYVKAAVEAGLIPAQSDYTVPASRELLVVASYAAYEQLKQEAAELTVTAAATGAKKVTITFNKPVDKSGVSVSVTSNNNPVNYTEAKWADDNKSLELSFANALAAANYVVTVSGVGDEALTASFTVEAERVEKIEFTSDKAVIDRGSENTSVKVGYKVTNQYGEDITSNVTLTPTASKGTPAFDGGYVVLTSNANNKFTLNEIVSVSLVYTSGTISRFASGTFTVSPEAKVSSIEITGFENTADKNKEPQVGQKAEEYRLLIEFKDQYGNKMTDAAEIKEDVIVTVSNKSVASVKDYNDVQNSATFGTNPTSLSLAIQGNDNFTTAGQSTIMLVSKSNGAQASYTVTVKQAVTIDNLTLSAPQLAPAGETVEIPFTAVDQFGNIIEHPTNDMLLSRSITGGNQNDIYFERDLVKDKTSLKVNLGAKGNTIVTLVTGTNKVASLTINVTDAKVPTVVSGTKDFETAVMKTHTVTVGEGNVVVKDQYNRETSVSYATYNGGTFDFNSGYYRAVVTSSNTNNVAVSGAYHTADKVYAVYDDQAVTLTGSNKGSSTITIKLQKYDTNSSKWVDVPNSSYSFTQRVVEQGDFTSYEASVAGTVYDSADDKYAKSLTVKGVLADGTKVTVPVSDDYYTVTVNAQGVQHVNGKIKSNGYNFGENNKTVEIPVIVVVKGSSQLHTVTVKLSNIAPAIETLGLKDSGDAKKQNDELITVANASLVNTQEKVETLVKSVVTAKDQYGQDLAVDDNTFAGIFVTNISGASNLAGLGKGDTITVTAITKNNKPIQFKVLVLND